MLLTDIGKEFKRKRNLVALQCRQVIIMLKLQIQLGKVVS